MSCAKNLRLTGEKGTEAVVRDVQELVLVTAHHGHRGGVGGGDNVFKLLSREDVGRGEVSLGVAVLSRLRGRNVHDLMKTTRRSAALKAGRRASRQNHDRQDDRNTSIFGCQSANRKRGQSGFRRTRIPSATTNSDVASFQHIRCEPHS